MTRVRSESSKAADRRRCADNKAWVDSLKAHGCTVCGSRESLQWDHVHPETKTQRNPRMRRAYLYHWSRDRIAAELVWCVLLCARCHAHKTVHVDGLGVSGEAAKRTVCPRGHKLTGANLRVEGYGRRCHICRYALRQVRWKESKGGTRDLDDAIAATARRYPDAARDAGIYLTPA